MKRKRNVALIILMVAITLILGVGAFQALFHHETRPASSISP
jgi:flagellar basal body-associated protein FliL